MLKAGKYTVAALALQDVLDHDPNNVKALWGLISATYLPAAGIQDPIDKNRQLDETVRLLKRAIELNPNDGDAYYTLGVVAWTRAFPGLLSARASIGMKREDPGPLTDFRVRQEMRARLWPVIEEGIGDLQKSLQMDDNKSDAMAYMNLLIRSRADICDTPEQAAEDIRTADDWVQRAMAVKRAGTESPRANPFSISPPAPPPPPAMPAPPGSIRMGGNIAAANLVTKVDPVYPPLALQARVEGTVRFNATIGKDGHIENLALVSGHPLLVGPAQQAVQQWVYRPTLLNGQPVQVITTIDVNFTLPAQ